jgi:Ni,Fe-hydrogenase III large subunit
MDTPSFLDRLRGTGVLPSEVASEWAATGPLARASGIAEDTRWERPTDSYGDLVGGTGPALEDGGDVLARLKVRWDEIDTSAALIGRALARLEGAHRHHRLAEPVEIGSGDAYGLGWAESAQGEVLHALSLRDGLIQRCFARTASLHNLVVFHDVFHGDVFTDFPFIEASFGLSYAGVAM